MKEILKLLAILCLLAINGCSNLNALSADTQAGAIHAMETHNLIIPIYHKDL